MNSAIFLGLRHIRTYVVSFLDFKVKLISGLARLSRRRSVVKLNVNRELLVTQSLVHVKQSRLEVNSAVVRTNKYTRPWNVNRELLVTRPLVHARQNRLEGDSLLCTSRLVCPRLLS